MNTTDPISDMLTRIRNANTSKHKIVDIPASKMKIGIAEILFKEGYIKAFEEINSDLFEELKSKCILSDQHTSFEALQKKYNFELFFCYVHIIRSFGASSAISILVREILFCKTQEEFESIYLRNIKTFKYLLEIGGSAVIHKEKFQKIFGFDENGNPVNRSTMMEPFFIRIQKGVPSSTNHI